MSEHHQMLRGRRVTLRPIQRAEARGLAESIAADPEASPWWTESPSEIERWLTERGVATFVIEAEGVAAGVLQCTEELDPYYRHAALDITLLAPYVGRGLGPEAMGVLISHLASEHGHHRFTVDPAASNLRAIRAYKSVGFRPIGIMRSYERGSDGRWRDGLLMELVIDPAEDR